MKKLAAGALLVALVMVLAACGGNDAAAEARLPDRAELAG